MGTHPIFESDFDCLTERQISSHEKIIASQKRSISKLESELKIERQRVSDVKLISKRHSTLCDRQSRKIRELEIALEARNGEMLKITKDIGEKRAKEHSQEINLLLSRVNAALSLP